MQLHKDSGQLRVIIDVSYESTDEFIDFIENEQCQFLESLGVDGLLKFEWYVDESTQTATLVEEFADVASFQELATKAIGTPVNLKFREIAKFENMTVLGDVSEEIKEKVLIEKTLSLKEKKQVTISIAKKGSKLKVINQAIKNAKESLNRKLYESQNNKELFEAVASKFNLETNINLIEVYDNSHIQGTNSVGALIAYGDDGFIKKRYRKFNIKLKKNEQDDYGMMKEVLNRRFKRAIQEKDNYLTFPDLVMIDGGKGQYSVARETLNELGLHDIPIIAIAKGKYRNSGNETFFHNGKEFKFIKNDPTLFFLQRIRDESHRFAISAHRAKRKKGISKSLLDQIDGIGSIRKRALLNHFGSARAVESASLDEIKSVEGVEEKVAKKIYNFFHE